MRLIRTSVVLLVTVALFSMTIPAAQARGLEKPQPAVHAQDGAWLDSAMSWLARLTGNEPSLRNRTMQSNTPPPPPTGLGGPHYVPQTGPCIDPMGAGRCNF